MPVKFECSLILLKANIMTSKLGTVHRLSGDPNAAWKEFKKGSNFVKRDVKPQPLDMPIFEDKVRFVCISDTHNWNTQYTVPSGDVLLHAGDFTNRGSKDEVLHFNRFLGTLPHKFKIVIAGNHELSFDPKTQNKLTSTEGNNRDELTNCIYLQDSLIEVYGLSIYGTPWQPEHGNWAFNLPRGQQCLDKWDKIPANVDVLLTHGPPLGYGDKIYSGDHVGCVDLLNTVQNRIKPKYHVYGHIHEDHGIRSDGETTFINCCICNLYYNPYNKPVIFDVPLPPGVFKDKKNKEVKSSK